MAANNNTQLNSTITRALAARALTFLALSWAVFLGVDLAIAAARTPASAFAHAIALVSRSTITASVSWAWIVVPVAVARPAFEYRRTQRPPPRVSWQVLELASPPVLIPALAHAFSAVGTYFVLARPLLVLVGLDGSRLDFLAVPYFAVDFAIGSVSRASDLASAYPLFPLARQWIGAAKQPASTRDMWRLRPVEFALAVTTLVVQLVAAPWTGCYWTFLPFSFLPLVVYSRANAAFERAWDHALTSTIRSPAAAQDFIDTVTAATPGLNQFKRDHIFQSLAAILTENPVFRRRFYDEQLTTSTWPALLAVLVDELDQFSLALEVVTPPTATAQAPSSTPATTIKPTIQHRASVFAPIDTPKAPNHLVLAGRAAWAAWSAVRDVLAAQKQQPMQVTNGHHQQYVHHPHQHPKGFAWPSPVPEPVGSAPLSSPPTTTATATTTNQTPTSSVMLHFRSVVGDQHWTSLANAHATALHDLRLVALTDRSVSAALAAVILARIVVPSYDEDQYGLVSNQLPTVVAALLRSAKTCGGALANAQRLRQQRPGRQQRDVATARVAQWAHIASAGDWAGEAARTAFPMNDSDVGMCRVGLQWQFPPASSTSTGTGGGAAGVARVAVVYEAAVAAIAAIYARFPSHMRRAVVPKLDSKQQQELMEIMWAPMEGGGGNGGGGGGAARAF